MAVVKSDFHGRHSGSWSSVWVRCCEEEGLPHELVDWRSMDSFDQLAANDIVVWHFSHYSSEEMHFARSILVALKASGCTVFPDVGDADHFDDKIAQSYLLRGLGLATPRNYPLHSEWAVDQWIREVGAFPVVAKLRAGSGATNVQLIKDGEQLSGYAKRMFGRGFNSKPSALFKLSSNVASSRSIADVVARMKRIPEFLFSLRSAKSRERERGYVYLQEFVPDVDYDLKVVVVGDRLSFIGRTVRQGDFRASGGGDLFYDRSRIDKSIIDTAFSAADALGSNCMGLDMITDPRSDLPLILEISYGFSHTALLAAGGYYDRTGVWCNAPLNAPEELLKNLVKKALSK